MLAAADFVGSVEVRIAIRILDYIHIGIGLGEH